jgi:hypothetical protein
MGFITKQLYALFILLSAASISYGDAQSDLYHRLEDTISIHTGQPYLDFSWMSPNDRTELIQYINANQNNLPDRQFIRPDEALFWLGDPTVVQEHVDSYRKADGGDDIGGPPDVLPYLVDDLTHASSINHIGVPWKHSLMDTSVINAYSIIAQWPAFPVATRAWAQRTRYNFPIYGSGPTATANSMMREWWEHNKDAVLSRQYDKATWLPPVSEEIPGRPMAASPAASSQPTPNQTSSSSALTQPDLSIPLWIYGVIVLSLGSIGGAWYFLRSKK